MPAGGARPRNAGPVRAGAAWPGQTLWRLRRDPLTVFTRAARDQGDVVRLPVPCQPLYLLSHADHVRDLLVTQAAKFGRGLAIERTRMVLGDGLLTSDGDRHQRHRRMMQPSFSRREPERHVEAIAATAVAHLARWRDGEVVDVSKGMAALTMDAVSHVLFGSDIGDSVDEATEALGVLLEFSDRLMLPLSGLWTALPVPAVRRARRALATLDAVLYRIIAAKRQRGPGQDVLSALIEARDSADPAHRLTDRELRDEAMTLLLAGHETTASALTWTWYLLAKHPDVHAAVRDEAHAALGGRLPSGPDLERLTYAEQVLAESMRLYPPVWSVGRRALEDVRLGAHVIPRHALAVVSQWVIHRDGRFWPDPDRFDPSRFADGGPARRPRPAYFPFGDGARRCIGESLAWTIGTTVLATLATRVQFDVIPDVDVVPIPYLFLLYPGHRRSDHGRTRPRRGLPMRAHLAAT